MGGAVFYTNSWPPLPARLIIEDPKHPVTQNVPSTIMAPANEWYQWKPGPRENKNVKVLATLDPVNYPIGIKDILTGGDTPVVWTNTKYNMVYINMGHGDFVMTDYFQNQMVTDALLWVGKGEAPRAKGEGPGGEGATPIVYPEMISITGNDTIANFKMAKTETTVGQWRTFCLATGRTMPEAAWFQHTEQHPVVNVSWDHAQAYCKWLSDVTGKNYRLPTEAEWEFAAKGGVKSKGFPYSGAKNPDSVAWLAHKSNGTMPVAQKAPNELGLFDMTGNVWEWCSDWYDSTKRFYTTRGGAWDIGPANSRISYRNPLAPTSRNHNKGFRVACD
jgi:formylglycine-generating enzyme required for sulfatase activity